MNENEKEQILSNLMVTDVVNNRYYKAHYRLVSHNSTIIDVIFHFFCSQIESELCGVDVFG
jgi:hypothetical protein